ncbi:unnamed protein product [Onchocerca flexuosa]|uniref:Uncharacterized protein n=1 Tax=Onchocerca flexuosa TaxID=387005 RepID=A0A183HZJ1_9BILA|nr:unnamed protein product [Onchocerca flexuosa]
MGSAEVEMSRRVEVLKRRSEEREEMKDKMLKRSCQQPSIRIAAAATAAGSFPLLKVPELVALTACTGSLQNVICPTLFGHCYGPSEYSQFISDDQRVESLMCVYRKNKSIPSGACCVSVVKDMGSETLEFEGRITILFFASYHGDAPFL